MIDKDLNLDLDPPLDLDLGPEADFSPFEVDFSPELLDSEPISPDESASISDPVAALEAALVRVTPWQIASARKAVDYLDRKH